MVSRRPYIVDSGYWQCGWLLDGMDWMGSRGGLQNCWVDVELALRMTFFLLVGMLLEYTMLTAFCLFLTDERSVLLRFHSRHKELEFTFDI
jgi:hypothetical protein